MCIGESIHKIFEFWLWMRPFLLGVVGKSMVLLLFVTFLGVFRKAVCIVFYLFVVSTKYGKDFP